MSQSYIEIRGVSRSQSLPCLLLAMPHTQPPTCYLLHVERFSSGKCNASIRQGGRERLELLHLHSMAPAPQRRGLWVLRRHRLQHCNSFIGHKKVIAVCPNLQLSVKVHTRETCDSRIASKHRSTPPPPFK